MKKVITFSLVVIWILSFQKSYSQEVLLENENLKLQWKNTSEGFALDVIRIKDGQNKIDIKQPSGKYLYLYSKDRPDQDPMLTEVNEKARSFPDSIYGHFYDRWKNSLTSVPLNKAGKAIEFFPNHLEKKNDKLIFTCETDQASIETIWEFDLVFKNDILVYYRLIAKKDGYFSIASPTLATVPEKQLRWGMVPGYFQGDALESDLVLSYGYGQGIPEVPVILRERAASTLSPLVSSDLGYTLSIIPEPGLGRDPWEYNKMTHNDWNLGLSVMNRNKELTPVVYHPVIGEQGSYLKEGDTISFRFRYSLQPTDWYTVYKHAINDIYHFGEFLELKDTKESLSDRLLALSQYVQDDSISMWNIQTYNKLNIGAQDYLSSVYDKDDDAMKNSDYGAMWMLATMKNTSLREKRLPYARNFKIAQQEKNSGFFQGAAKGQYYLWKSKRFVEEWGNYVEPIGLTYYVMLDIGNILLFNPKDTVLRKQLRLGADKLLDWQHPDGHWEVAYAKETEKPVFTDLKDLRPTFYGLIVASRVLGDEKYLKAAQKGADWFIKNAVDKGHFLGVCGDFRFAPDFATAQGVQALLDLYEMTSQSRYKEAAIKAARLYTTYIYTHPIASKTQKSVNGINRQDWEISQSGLRVEQTGLLGSANVNGPILLSNHAGMFVRLFQLTQDSLYIDMARAAVWGRDAFVNSKTKVQSYYWKSMDAGVGRYPHHAWWQIGWIVDYLLSETELRSHGKISFPRGFITPKVGPHQSYGFEKGKVFGNSAKLFFQLDSLVVSNSRIDYVGAIDSKKKKLYVILLNNSVQKQFADVNVAQIESLAKEKQFKVILRDDHGNKIKKFRGSNANFKVELPAYGLRVIELDI